MAPLEAILIRGVSVMTMVVMVAVMMHATRAGNARCDNGEGEEGRENICK
jgi:hypothetical protein